MKNYNIIKWLISLDAQKLVLAILLIAVSVLYIENKSSQNKNDSNTDRIYQGYEARLAEKKDCDSIVTAIRLEYNAKYEAFLKEQIQKLENNKEKINSVISKNNTILRKNLKRSK